MIWIQFIISALVIVFCGIKLTQYADALSERLNLGKAWVGVLLLGFITSLPEALTCIWSVLSLQAYDLAIGNIIGSNNFNPFILVILDLMSRRKTVSEQVRLNTSHNWSARACVWLSLIVFMELLLQQWRPLPTLGPISIGTMLIVGVYLFGMHGAYKCDQGCAEEESCPAKDVKLLYPKLFAVAVIVVVAAIALTNTCDQIAAMTGLGRTFIGSLLLAFVTSLPEIVVSISAIRIGAMDMAIGNIFGSNMTNIAIIVLCDLVSPAAILGMVQPIHLVSLTASVVMVSWAVLLINKPIKNLCCHLSWVSWVMLITFFSSAGLLYYFK